MCIYEFPLFDMTFLSLFFILFVIFIDSITSSSVIFSAYAYTLASLLDSLVDWTFFTLGPGDCSSGSDDSSPDVLNSASLLSGDSAFKNSIKSSHSCIFLAFVFFFDFSFFVFLSLSFLKFAFFSASFWSDLSLSLQI